MDTNYLNMLCEYCQEIQQQELTLQDIKMRFLPPQSLPLYRLRPTIILLWKIKKIPKKNNPCPWKRCTMENTSWMTIKTFNLGTTININWCCRCHAHHAYMISYSLSIRFIWRHILVLYTCLIIHHLIHLYVYMSYSVYY